MKNHFSQVSPWLKKKPSLFRRLLHLISGRDDPLISLKDADGYIIGSATVTEDEHGLKLEGHILDPQFVNELNKTNIATLSIWGNVDKEEN